jgi:hypothetical protein
MDTKNLRWRSYSSGNTHELLNHDGRVLGSTWLSSDPMRTGPWFWYARNINIPTVEDEAHGYADSAEEAKARIMAVLALGV